MENELRGISTRTDVRLGNDITIAGFVIAGSQEKCVVVQGLGPGVAVPDGVPRLPDPVLTLKSGLTTIAHNDNWQVQDDPSHVQIIQSLGRAPSQNLEAAIYMCLPPGAYTALLTGRQNSTGVGIIAVYDADQRASYLANISTRSWVGTGHFISIAGFVIKGDKTKEIFIRGSGPSLRNRFPAEAQLLANPRLRLYRGSQLIASNDDWANAPNADDIAALPDALIPGDAREPAILTELEPGLYTAHLLGAANDTGNGLIAVWDRTGR